MVALHVASPEWHPGVRREERGDSMWQTGGSEKESGWRRARHSVTPLWLLIPSDRFQLLLLRPFHVYDICTCLASLTACVTSLGKKNSLRTRVTCQTSPSGCTNAPDTRSCEFTLPILGKYFSREPSYSLGSHMSCRTQSRRRCGLRIFVYESWRK